MVLGNSILLKFLSFLYCCFQSIICQQFHENFIRPDICTDKVLISLESYLSLEARSVIQCAARCSLDNNCLSFSFIKKDRNCFLNAGRLNKDCENGITAAGSVYYKKKLTVKECLNNGTLVNNNCVCYGGYVGTYCERLMTDCSEGYREMYQDGQPRWYKALPPGATESFTLICKMDWGGRTIILHHFDRLLTLNRTWTEYRDGFYHGIGATWIGLEKLYWLSLSKNLDLYVQFKKKSNPSKFVKIVYENFEIGNSSTNYQLLSAQLNRARSEINVTGCLSDLIGSSFSSYDMDNNQVQGLGCPAKYGGGWWYNGACAHCNPMGDLRNTTGGTGFFWEPLLWTPEGIAIWFQN